MKVLHVIPSVSKMHGGPSYAIKSLAKASQCAGISVTIATTDDDGDEARLEVRLGQAVERDGIAHVFFRRDFLPYKVSFGLRRWLRQNVSDFDFVHIHALFSFSSLVAARAAQKYRVPYIIRPLGVLNRWGMRHRRRFLKQLWMKFIELPLLRRAAAIHYTSERERGEAVEADVQVAKIPSFIIPIPVEDETTPKSEDASAFVRRFPKAAHKKLILFMSRLDPKKGVELLLKSFVSVKQGEPAAMLVIAGNGETSYVASLHAIAAELGIEVLWTGFLDSVHKSAAFATATVFVLPSYSENFGIAAAEALAAGVPTILSDQVAIARDVETFGGAVVIPPREPELSTALLRVLADVSLREQLSKNGRAVAARLFSPQSVGESLANEYKKIRAVKPSD